MTAAAEQLEVLVVCTLPAERDALRAQLGRPRRRRGAAFELDVGRLDKRAVGVLLPDPKPTEQLEPVFRSVLRVHNPRRIVVAQLAVALTPSYRRGQLLEASRVCWYREPERFRIERSPDGPYPAVSVLSVAHWPVEPEQRQKLAERTGCDVAAYRAYAVAKACPRVDAHWLYVIRASGEALEPGLVAALGPTLAYRAGAALSAFAAGWRGLVELQAQRSEARKLAQAFAEQVFRSLC